MDEDNETPPNKIDFENIVMVIRCMINNGNEISCLIGPGGCIVRRLRQQSGAKVSISDGSCPDRIVTVSGSVDCVCTAYNYMCTSLHDYHMNRQQRKNASQLLTLKLIIPASHCGSIIGKSGCKIKEIRDLSCASVQVGQDMLPISTERIVTVSGNPDSISQAIYQICLILIECTMTGSKGVTIPYEPKASNTGLPVILSGGNAYTLHGEYAVPVQEVAGKRQPHPLAGLATLGTDGVLPTTITTSALAALSNTALKSDDTNNSQPPEDLVDTEIVLTDDIAGCVLGKAGSRLLEIRQISGAQIQVNSHGDGKVIHVQGVQEAVSLAQYLINMCIELQKTNANSADNPEPEELENAISAFMTSSANTSLIEKQTPTPASMNSPAVTMGNLIDLLANITPNHDSTPVTTTGAYRKDTD